MKSGSQPRSVVASVTLDRLAQSLWPQMHADGRGSAWSDRQQHKPA
jgi:hypothetical protein